MHQSLVVLGGKSGCIEVCVPTTELGYEVMIRVFNHLSLPQKYGDSWSLKFGDDKYTAA